MTGREMRQVAPYPQELADLVAALRYRQHLGWRVWLEDDLQRDKPGRHSGESRGLTLVVQRCGPNSYHHAEHMVVNHYFPVPPATYNRQSWMRWLFDRLGDVDTHERMEDFAFATVVEVRPGTAERNADKAEVLERPLAPCHGPGWDPYAVTYERAELDRRTSFQGVLDDDGTGQPKQP